MEMVNSIGTMLIIALLLVVILVLAYRLGKRNDKYDALVQQFILYKASGENPAGAGILLQAEKLKGISRERNKIVEKPPLNPEETGVVFRAGVRT